MSSTLGGSGAGSEPSGVPETGQEETRVDRVEALAAQVRELDAQLRARSGTAVEVPGGQVLVERLKDRVEVLVQRVDTLSDTARAASSGLVARERELAAIRREVADAQARVDSAVADFHRRIDRGPVEALQRTVAGLVDEVATLHRAQDVLTGRVDSLADTVDAARATLTAHERALGGVSTELESVGTRMDSVVVVVRQAVESLLEQVEPGGARATARPADSALRLDALTEQVEQLAAGLHERLDEVDAKLADREARPRLVTWGQRDPETEVETGGIPTAELLPGAVTRPAEESPVEPSHAENEVRNPIASFGGGT